MICAIHQPNFIPWLPFFRKIEQADVFIVLSHCQYEKGGYQNRFNISGKWHTMSVRKHIDLIARKKYANPLSDWNKIKTNLSQYAKILERFDKCIMPSLMDANLLLIYGLCVSLGINKDKLMMDYPTGLMGTMRLIELCQHFGCDTYLSGVSGSKYMDMSLWERAGIKVITQKIEPCDKIPILEVLK